jgi:hydroxyethylthiazole kinase
MMELEKFFRAISEAIWERHPLVHHITNYVTAGFCADAALAIGASPMMADEPAEMDEISEKADAVVCNLGTFNKRQSESFFLSAKAALTHHKPLILDPVGVMSSRLRLETARELLSSGAVSILKGNSSEGRTLLDWDNAMGKGVDSRSDIHPEIIAKALAKTFHCTAVVTGAVDAVSDGKRVYLGKNGTPYLSRITGAGCMTGTLIGSAAAVCPDFVMASLWGLTCLNSGAEVAEKDCPGPGTFRARLMDAISHHNGTVLAERFRGGKIE